MNIIRGWDLLHKLLYHKRNINTHQPVSLIIDATGKCNLNCEFCFTKNHPRKDLELDIIKQVINKMPTLKSVEIGMGEPTLYPYINELIEFCDDKGLAIGFGSNGLTLNKIKMENFEKLSWIVVGITYYIDNGIIPDFNWVPTKLSYIYVYHEKSPKNEVLIDRLLDFKNKNYEFNYFDIRMDIRKGIHESVKYDFMALERTIKKYYPEFNIIRPKEKFKSYKGICHSAYLKPFLCNDGYIYACCVDTRDLDFNPKKRICKWDEFDDYNIAFFADCPECSKADMLECINNYLNDKDVEFI